MTDTFSRSKRSEVMRAVRSRGNKSTELTLIEVFKKNGITGWRRNYPLFGSPDFVFRAKKIAIFIDGCFWHGHNCRNTTPKDNAAYWNEKLARNRRRDELVTKTLREKKWNVTRVWECELKTAPFSQKLKNLLIELA